MKKSGVMPIHNEEKYLPFSLASLLYANLDELIVVLDRCTDRSEQIINSFSEIVSYSIRKIIVKERCWFYPTAEVFKIGFEAAEGDIIYSLAGDCYYNPQIFRINWENIDFASFPYLEYPIHGDLTEKLHANWVNFYKFILNIIYPKLTKKERFSGIYAFKKHVYNAIPRVDVMSEDIWFLKEAWNRGFRYKYFPDLISLHLRPALLSQKQKQRWHGIARAKMGYPLWKVLAHSILLGKPETFRGYIQARRRPTRI